MRLPTIKFPDIELHVDQERVFESVVFQKIGQILSIQKIRNDSSAFPIRWYGRTIEPNPKRALENDRGRTLG